MSTTVAPTSEPTTRSGQAPAGLRYDWWAVAVFAWPIIGVYTDTWAHKHIVDELESFFTPWHAVLYSGLLVSMLFLGITAWRNGRVGYRGWGVLPAGYKLSAIGALLFGVGGAADMFWHELFGIEVGLDAGFSPTHLLIGVSIGLMVTGPIRAAFYRRNQAPNQLLPALISIGFMLAMFSVMSLFVHPFVTPFASSSRHPGSNGTIIFLFQSVAMAAVFIQTTIFMGVLLMALRNWRLPFGSVTIMLTINVVLLSVVEDEFQLIIAAVIGGLLADLLVHYFQPTAHGKKHIRWLCAAVPSVIYASYYGTIILSDGTWWTIHLWSGSIFIAGFVGWLMSYLLFPPESGQTAVNS